MKIAPLYVRCELPSICDRRMRDVRWKLDDGKSKMTKTPTRHHTIIIITAVQRDLSRTIARTQNLSGAIYDRQFDTL